MRRPATSSHISYAASLAATRANRHQRIAIAATYQNLVYAGADTAAQQAAEDALQAAIVDASGDELLRQMGSVVRMGLRAMRPISRMQALAHDLELADYGKVVRAIEGGDADGAKAAMMRLLTLSAEQLLVEAA